MHNKTFLSCFLVSVDPVRNLSDDIVSTSFFMSLRLKSGHENDGFSTVKRRNGIKTTSTVEKPSISGPLLGRNDVKNDVETMSEKISHWAV